MNIVTDFKAYLFSQKKPAGAITIKNYVADVRKFIGWFESSYGISFTPDNFTRPVINQYQSSIQQESNSQASVNSIKRYLSSLRKLAVFMYETRLIASNPFIEYEKNRATQILSTSKPLKITYQVIEQAN